MKEDILSLIQNINAELYLTYKQNILLKDEKVYNRCYSAIYLIEDITEAFDYYKKCNEEIFELGAKYLMIYGVLEALYMQQEALNDLLNALGYEKVNYKNNYPEIYKIRETRKDVAGHPTYRDYGEYTTYLSRPDLSLRTIKYEETQYNTFIDFDIIASIDIQEQFIKSQLEEILNKLREEKSEHIENFKNDKLLDCFKMFNYAYGKIHSKGHFYAQNDSLGFRIVLEIIEKLKEKLNNRYVDWKKTTFSYDIETVEKIYEYLLSKPEIINEEGDENTFLKINLLENMFYHLKDLEDTAKEIDTEYENNFEIKGLDKNIILPPIIIKDKNGEEVELNV